MMKSFSIPPRFDANRFVDSLTMEINSLRGFKAEWRRQMDNIWKIRIHDKGTRGYVVKVVKEGNRLGIDVAESTGSTAFHAILELSLLAFAIGSYSKSKNTRDFQVAHGAAKPFLNSSAGNKLEKCVANFCERYFRNI